MNTVETVLIALLVVNGLALGGLILLQQGRGADVGAAFGSGAANTVFGSQGSTSFLTKLTTWLAICFFAITFGLAYIAKEKAQSLGEAGLSDLIETPVEPEIPALDAGDSGSADEGNEPVESDVPLVD